MQDVISVIIPVYNHAHTLSKCISTVLNQQIDLPDNPIEIIIVNDGSADDFELVMAKILQNDLAKDKIIKVINQENKGAPTARNNGFKEAKGEFVIFVDADTICAPYMFKKMHEVLQAHPEASYAYCQFYFGFKKMSSHTFDIELLKKMNYIDVTSLIRTKDFIGFDESLKRFQDWDLWLSMLEKNKTGVFVPQVLYKKIIGRRQGISTWLPSFIYKIPWKTKAVKDYEAARDVIFKKHHLI